MRILGSQFSLLVLMICFLANCAGKTVFTNIVADGSPQNKVDAGALVSDAAPTTPDAFQSGIIGPHMYWSTHEDDDILFMTPDIKDSIRHATSTQIVYVTAGDAVGTRPYAQREDGIKAAYSMMATGTANYTTAWQCADLTILTKVVHRCTLLAQPNLQVIFMRLPDSSSTFPKLWDKQAASVATVDNSAMTYTREELIATMQGLMDLYKPTRIGSQDPGIVYGNDHYDHYTTSRFVFAAHQRYATPHLYTFYRGYNISNDPANLWTPDSDEAAAAFNTYCAPAHEGECPLIVNNSYYVWTQRVYPIAAYQQYYGALGNGLTLCLGVSGNQNLDGAAVEVQTCADSTGQKWQINPSGQIIGLGNKCLTLKDDNPTAGSSIQLATCQNKPGQKWTALSNGQIRGLDGQCLGVNGGAVNGASTIIQNCQGQARSGVNEQYDPLPSQTWTPQPVKIQLWTSGQMFSDAEVAGAASYYQTMRLGDLNGDGYADACIRRSDGVWCALNNKNGSFTGYVNYSTAFADNQGWLDAAYGTTIQLGDINGDGRVDICGRSVAGIACALVNATGTAFGAISLWSNGHDFSDAAGFNANASYYGSLRLVDVNGDKVADVCGRRADGIVCALNNKQNGFVAATSWFNANFRDADGWGQEKYAATLQFADINGDGRIDVCGRGIYNLFCALGNANHTGFERLHIWSLRDDFSDTNSWGNNVSYYGSLRLVDVNHDKRADLCGRGPNGIVCGFSTGVTFDKTLNFFPRDFTDALAWANEKYGPTIQWADLNADGHPDMCARGAYGLMCLINQ